MTNKNLGAELLGSWIKEVETLRAELDEQCRLNGMGAQRELKLITEVKTLRAEMVAREQELLEIIELFESANDDQYREARTKLAKYIEINKLRHK